MLIFKTNETQTKGTRDKEIKEEEQFRRTTPHIKSQRNDYSSFLVFLAEAAPAKKATKKAAKKDDAE